MRIERQRSGADSPARVNGLAAEFRWNPGLIEPRGHCLRVIRTSPPILEKSMSTKPHSYDALNLIKDQLAQEIQDELLDQLMYELVEEFKGRAWPLVSEKVNSIVFSKMEALHNILQMRDELKVFVEWKDPSFNAEKVVGRES